ncbi:MAG: hypothetical protein ACPGU1_17360 [Myxococcota bacterium]
MQQAGITDVDVNVAGPFRIRRLEDDYLITNDFGDWLFLTAEELKSFVEGTVEEGAELYERLNSKRFIHGSLNLNEAAERYRARRWFLDHGPRTHSLAMCGADAETESMSPELLDRAVDCAFMSTSPELVFEMTGPAPLLNWAGIERVVTYVESKNRLARKRVSMALVTSLETMTDEMVSFLAEHRVQVCARVSGADVDSWVGAKTWLPKLSAAYSNVEADAQRLHASLHHTALVEDSDDLSAVVDFAVAMECQTVLLEPTVSQPFLDGEAEDSARLATWLDSYDAALNRCLHHEAEGQPIAEVTARVLAQRILGDRAPNDARYRSPAADGIGEMAYHWDGRVFSSEAGRQLAQVAEDEMFKIGELRIHGYHDMITSPTVRALVLASLVEGQPACNDSAYAPFGGLSPAACYAEHGSIHGRPAEHSHWVRLVRTLDQLFNHLRCGDDAARSALHRWSEPS